MSINYHRCAKLQEYNHTTITLTEKITVDNKDIQKITLRRPKVRDRLAVERMGQSDTEKEWP